jgi:hypothetical protein
MYFLGIKNRVLIHIRIWQETYLDLDPDYMKPCAQNWQRKMQLT